MKLQSDTLNWIVLSHPFDSGTPGYGGSVGFEQQIASQITNGSSSNSKKWNLSNHTGTHIDFPRHFFDHGASLTDYEPRQFLFSKAQLIHSEVPADTIITPTHLQNWLLQVKHPQELELLLIRTGFEKNRHQESYWKNNPGFHPDCANELRKHLPQLRAIGFDFISLTSFQNRPLGREAHKAFLSPQNPLWIIEDMKLSQCPDVPLSCLVSPLWVDSADGSPVTVWASY